MSTALVFFCVKCAFKNLQNLKGVMSKSTRCQTERCKSSCASVCKRTQMIDQIWQKSLTNLSSSRKCFRSLVIFLKRGMWVLSPKIFSNSQHNHTRFSTFLCQGEKLESVKQTYHSLPGAWYIYMILFPCLVFLCFWCFPQVTILIQYLWHSIS